MHAPRCPQGDAKLGSLEAFILRKASRGDPRSIAMTDTIQRRAEGLGIVSGAQPDPACMVPKYPPVESMSFTSGNHEVCSELMIRADGVL
jgi:hypothetical protein